LEKSPFRSASLVLPVLYTEIQLLEDLFCSRSLPSFHTIAIVISGVKPSLFTATSSIVKGYLKPTESNIHILCKSEVLPPGSARNEGVNLIDSDYIVFLDVRTIPTTLWPCSLCDFILAQSHDLQLGSVQYLPSSSFHKCLLAATYGFKPLKSLPGLITTREAFHKIGCFLPLRAGEDVEWITRARMLSLKINEPNIDALLRYSLPCDLGLYYYIRKWFRYYSASFLIPSYWTQRYLYILFSFSTILLFLTSWNWRLARWDESSFLYIPYVTRLSLLCIFSLYLVFRGIIIPIKKGFPMRPCNILTLSCSFLVALCLDLAKMIAAVNSLFSSFKP